MFDYKKYYTINPNILNGFVTAIIIIILNWLFHKIQFSIPKLRVVTFELSGVYIINNIIENITI